MANKVKPTKEQFMEYLEIRDSGVTNMFDIRYITGVSYSGLTREICMYIMDNFEALLVEYEVEP